VGIAPITSTIRHIPSEVILTPEDGLPKPCAVNLDHVQTVAKAKVGSFIATLDDRRMDQVRTALLFALGFRTNLNSNWYRFDTYRPDSHVGGVTPDDESRYFHGNPDLQESSRPT
jgi:hypothetical protein